MIAHGLLRWWKAELANAWTYVVKPRPLAAPTPVTLDSPGEAPVRSVGEGLAPPATTNR